MTRMTPSGTKNRAHYPDVRTRKAVLARAVALVALLGVTGCSSLSGLVRSEPDPSVKLAGIFLSVGAPDAALRAADDALTRQPGNAVALKARADALAQMGQMEEAQRAYGALIAATPSDIAPRIALGRLLVQSNPAAAEQVFAEVLMRQPDNAIAMNNMGIARDLQGRHGEAQAAYRAARAVDPKMTGASVNLGLSQVLAGDMNEAVRTLTPLAALDDAPATVHENLGIALAARGETAEAKRVLGRVMSPAEVNATLAQYRGARTPQTAVIAPRQPAPMPGQTAMAQVALTPVVPLPVPVTALAMPIAPGTQAEIAPPAATPAARPGAAYVQLAMAQSAGRARARWAEIRTSHKTLLGDHRLVIAATSFRDQAVWAVRTGPFASPRQAESFCLQLRSAGQDCWAMVPSPDAPDVTLAASAAPASARPDSAAIATPAELPAAAPAGRTAYAQLAASDSEAAVIGEWARLRRQIGPLLRDRQQITMAAEVAGRQVWRLRTGPFEQPRAAEAFCTEVRAVGGKCWAAAGS